MARWFFSGAGLIACLALFGAPAAGQVPGGVLIDAEGVLQSAHPGSIPAIKKPAAKSKTRPDDRCVSLKRLEAAVRAAGPDVRDWPESLQTLGGLTRIDEILLAVDERDIYLVGPGDEPGEGDSRFTGKTSGRPFIRTEDWVVVLRAASRNGGVIACSIDPDEQRLKRYNAHIQSTIAQVNLNSAGRWYAQLAEILGRQNVTVDGVPSDSRAAATIVVADYEMKRIALGIDDSGVKTVKSQLAFAGGDKGSTMQRWWFTALYDPVRVDHGRERFALSGQRVQLCAQSELIGADGRRHDAPRTHLSSQKFAKAFTDHYREMEAVRPIYAELANLFDVAVAATIISREKLFHRAQWRENYWLDEDLKLPTQPVAKFVESTSTTRVVNETTVVGLVGGVTFSAGDVLSGEAELSAPADVLAERRSLSGPVGEFAWTISRRPK
jgi:hypothetical protein